MRKKVITIILILIIVICGGTSLFVFIKNETMSDSLKFKEEYESLNNTVRKSDGANYNKVSIDKNNPIKYVDAKKALDVLKMDNAILYIGANWCPYCRSAVPILFEVAQKYKVKTIYYLNLDDEKDTFEIQDGKLVKTVDGTKSYYELLDYLSENLNDYILYDEDGNSYNTLEKRIYMPYVLGIKNGKVVATYQWEIEFNDNQTKYDKLTTSQHDELFNSYDAMFKLLYGENESTCNVSGSCN